MERDAVAKALAAGRAVEGVDLGGVAWEALEAEDAHFVDCTLDGGSFANAMLAGASFLRCRFRACRFAHADLHDARFEECAFTTRDDPAGACAFVLSDLRQARFLRCDLSLCRFERADLYAVEMEQCVLRGARFHQVDFSHAFSRKHVATRAVFRACNLELAEMADARLPGCDLTGSRFREADLGGADLSDAVLRDADLFQAILTGAKLDGADLRGAELSGVNLLALASFAGVKVDAGQQHQLLAAMGVAVDSGVPS